MTEASLLDKIGEIIAGIGLIIWWIFPDHFWGFDLIIIGGLLIIWKVIKGNFI
jgi:hypothetical protein